MDIDGYPDEEELNKIETWNANDCHGLMAYIHDRWAYADSGYWENEDEIYRLHTGGWSGNESIIAALERNIMFWALYWFSSMRGGHYEFRPIIKS